MNQLPDPRRVRTRADFVAFTVALVSSLDAAMLEPEPGPWVDERGGWTNWVNRWMFWEAMTGWLTDTKHAALAQEPIGQVLLAAVPKPSRATWDGTSGLRGFLVSLRDWAAGPTPDGSAEMWSRAAEAMRAGAVYE